MNVCLGRVHAASYNTNRIFGVMVRVGSSPGRVIPKTIQIDICCISGKHAALRRKSKDWSARNLDNVSKWGDMSIRGLLF
jgi:hypothetical protein